MSDTPIVPHLIAQIDETFNDDNFDEYVETQPFITIDYWLVDESNRLKLQPLFDVTLADWAKFIAGWYDYNK